jgi:predicted RNA-binding Zn-ribbon protein involved in translation (DUF1610 family)
MEAILNSASDPSDLIPICDAKIPYRFDQIFRARGFGAKWLERRRLALMKEIDPSLQRLLAEGEKVLFVSWGVHYSVFEQYVMGPWVHLVSRRALVFTDRRIVTFQISARRKLLELKAQIRYPAIDSVAKKTWGYLGLILQNGKRIHWTDIPRRDRVAIESLVEAKLAAGRATAPVMVGMENLCPKCGHRVMGRPERCGQCTQSFKSNKRAGWLSLAIPGLGDLYLGHRGLGLLEICGTLLVWGLALPLAWATYQRTGSWIEPAAITSVVFTLVHVGNATITRRMGSKGIYPDD